MCVWHEDADSLKKGDAALDVIFENNFVRSYLSNKQKYLGIAATKGQGKTFLIKTKRNRLSSANNQEFEAVTCFPKDSSLVDTLSKGININHSIKGLLQEYRTWVLLWQFSVVATITNSNEYKELYTHSDFRNFSDGVLFFFNRKKQFDKNIGETVLQYAENISNPRGKPSIIFSRLLSLNKSELQLILKEANLALQLLDRITNGIYIFIDKVDQAFDDVYKIKKKPDSPLSANASYWQYCQYALAEAAYNLFSFNNHIKLFYTIRLEAILDSHLVEKNISRNIESFLIELSYSKNDIYEMFELYVSNEADDCLFDGSLKNENAEKAFFGFEKIPHAHIKNEDGSPVEENLFDYLYRHSLRRPCDLMLLCKNLYLRNPKELTVKTIRRVVNESSGKVLRRYLSEVEPFITTTLDEFEQLLSTINTNIFNLEYLKFACERYNTERGNITGCNKDCLVCTNIHPFSTLYNIGLLGYLRESFANPTPTQHFLPIGESKLKLNEHDLKNSELFFLHPCLCDISRNTRKNNFKEFITSELTIVGEGVEVKEDKISQIKNSLPMCIEKLNDDKIFVSSTVNDLIEERQAVKKELVRMNLYPILSEEPNFTYGFNDVDSHDHCIDEVLNCKQLVFIIGNEYGGEYAGDRYVDLKEHIIADSQQKIKKPSISLMELYAARANNINYKVFINKNVLKEQHDAKNGVHSHDSKCDKRVFDIVNFITHLHDGDRRKGNWRLVFEDATELSALIRSQSFSGNGLRQKQV
ncbi:MAG: DUF4062 domain-containing protein [Oscillospiraceae bacterium]|nr:DUF4062 domain-containing protein [Oscillospiraceae bacterium]